MMDKNIQDSASLALFFLCFTVAMLNHLEYNILIEDKGHDISKSLLESVRLVKAHRYYLCYYPWR